MGAFQGYSLNGAYDNAFQDDAFDIYFEQTHKKRFLGRELILTQYVTLQQQKDKIQFKDIYDE